MQRRVLSLSLRSRSRVPCQLARRPLRSFTKDRIGPFLFVYPTSYHHEVTPSSYQRHAGCYPLPCCIFIVVHASFYVNTNNGVHTLRRVLSKTRYVRNRRYEYPGVFILICHNALSVLCWKPDKIVRVTIGRIECGATVILSKKFSHSSALLTYATCICDICLLPCFEISENGWPLQRLKI